jgi:hypothetical protein
MDTQLATQSPSVGSMLGAFIDKGLTPDNVAAFKELIQLHREQVALDAAKEFAVALADLQAETIHVQATKKVDEKVDGSCRYKFAPYESIMKEVQPMLAKHGFSISFDTENGDQRLTSICTLMHKGGHSKVNKFAVRYGKPPGSSDAQGDMSTKSYAKRGALCDCLNITIDHDDDARMEGATISADEAAQLEARVEKCHGDKAKFLKLAGSTSFDAITTAKMDVLLDFLERKERQSK